MFVLVGAGPAVILSGVDAHAVREHGVDFGLPTSSQFRRQLVVVVVGIDHWAAFDQHLDLDEIKFI